ncbi:sulfur carrier protein ThiS [Myxococcota bacterium]
MQVRLNGQPRELKEDSSLPALLSELRLSAEHVVVEYNGEVLAADRLDSIVMRPGDTLELVHLVGGG